MGAKDEALGRDLEARNARLEAFKEKNGTPSCVSLEDSSSGPNALDGFIVAALMEIASNGDTDEARVKALGQLGDYRGLRAKAEVKAGKQGSAISANQQNNFLFAAEGTLKGLVAGLSAIGFNLPAQIDPKSTTEALGEEESPLCQGDPQ